jgi:molecular chaperone DnaJ
VVRVPTIDETIEFTVPEGTQSGQTFTLRGKGIKTARRGTGNLLLHILVEVPTKLSREQKKQLEDWTDGVTLKQYDKMKKYADNVEMLYGDKVY